jgi:hypothetical protein
MALFAAWLFEVVCCKSTNKQRTSTRSTHIKQAFHRKVHQQDTDFVIMTSTVEATFVGTIFWNIF